MLDSQATSAAIYKQLFTGAEWDAIALAMKDYGDFHGGMDETIANNVQAKIAKIFELTANWFFTLFHSHFFTMFQHKLPNGNVIMHEGLPKWMAIKRMEDHKRWEQEHREELEQNAQQLFDDMFGGW